MSVYAHVYACFVLRPINLHRKCNRPAIRGQGRTQLANERGAIYMENNGT